MAYYILYTITGNRNRKASGGYKPYQRTPENIKKVAEIIKRSPRKSVKRLSREVEMSEASAPGY